MENMNAISRSIRRRTLEMHYSAKDSHIGCALSSVDILCSLFFKVLNINPKKPNSSERDRFVLSKGHAAAALYATMCERGFFLPEAIVSFAKNGSPIASHVDRNHLPGVETTGGSGGHGLPIGVGMALSSQIDSRTFRVFVLMGDGELQEGSVWEAAMFAASRRLANLTLIVDCNEFQTWTHVADVVAVEPIAQKFRSFGWIAREINGHDFNELVDALSASSNGPQVIIARTIKGKGVSFMEGSGDWHNGVLTTEQYNKARKELSDA